MELREFLLCIIVNAIWIVPISLELILSIVNDYRYKKKVRKANKEYIKIHGRRLRKLCINCSYCRCKYYHPFSSYGKNYWTMASKIPCYCRKFNKQLKNDSFLRCISELNSEAMFEQDRGRFCVPQIFLTKKQALVKGRFSFHKLFYQAFA